MGKNQHVVPHKDGWAVQGEGNSKPTRVTSTQKEAIQIALKILHAINNLTPRSMVEMERFVQAIVMEMTHFHQKTLNSWRF